MTAGFPCQAFSLAGVSKKNSLGVPHGFDDKRHGDAFFKLANAVAIARPAAPMFEIVKNIAHWIGRQSGVELRRILASVPKASVVDQEPASLTVGPRESA